MKRCQICYENLKTFENLQKRMSSNIIPIVSSSPPPLDASPSFDEAQSFSSAWDDRKVTEDSFYEESVKTSKHFHNDVNIDDDHGNKNNGATIDANGFVDFPEFNNFEGGTTEDNWGDFNDANTTSENTQLPCEIKTKDSTSSEISKDIHISTEDINTEIVAETHDDDGFGDIVEVNVKSNKCENSETVSLTPSQCEKETVKSNEKTGPDKQSTKSCLTDMTMKPNAIHKVNDSQDSTSQDSVTDSGLSSDISPIPKSEDDKEYANFQAENMESKTEVIEEPQSSSKNDSKSDLESDAKISCENDNSNSLQEDIQGMTELDEEKPENQKKDINEEEEEITFSKNDEPELLNLKPSSFPDNDGSEYLNQYGDEFGQFQDFVEIDAEEKEITSTVNPAKSDDNVSDSEELASAEVNKKQIDNTLDTSQESDKNSVESNSIKHIPDPKQSDSNSESNKEGHPEKESLNDSCEENTCHSNSENKGEEDDFGDFGGAQTTGETDFDDFGDFGEAPPVAEASNFGAFSDSQNTEGEDWAAFGSGTSGNTFADAAPAAQDSGDDWAAFQEPQLTVKASEEDDDDDFGDFDDAPNDFQTFESSGSSQVFDKDVTSVVTKCFPEKEVNGNVVDSDQLLEIMGKEMQRREEMQIKQPGRMPVTKSTTYDVNVWNNLKDLENTIALKYQWNKSNNSQHLLQAIAIDTRNILIGHKKQAVPIFAAGLGLLEPSKSSPMEPRRPMTINSQKDGVQLIQDTQRPDSGLVPSGRMVNTPQDIPPAEFDWSSSGLTNPLDSLETEFLKEIEPSRIEAPKQLQPLENLLANMNFTPTAPINKARRQQSEEKMSSESQNIMKSFPNISFMRAKVLMFPLKGNIDQDRDP